MSTEIREHPPAKQMWEYRCDRLGGLHTLATTLDRAGEESWELVTIVNETGIVCPVFKRPKLPSVGQERIVN